MSPLGFPLDSCYSTHRHFDSTQKPSPCFCWTATSHPYTPYTPRRSRLHGFPHTMKCRVLESSLPLEMNLTRAVHVMRRDRDKSLNEWVSESSRAYELEKSTTWPVRLNSLSWLEVASPDFPCICHLALLSFFPTPPRGIGPPSLPKNAD